MISIDRDLRLPDSLRDELRTAFGRVMESSEIIDLLKKEPPEVLVAVGDSVSLALISGGLFPSLIVWDGKVKREPTSEESIRTLSDYTTPLRVNNPPATITQEAWDLVSSQLGEKKVSIFVEGEEDLLTIPAILNSEEGSVVVYGLPPEKGAILIVVDRKIKSVFQDILSRFE